MLSAEDERTKEVVDKLLQMPIHTADAEIGKVIEGSKINLITAIAIISGFVEEVMFSDGSSLKLNKSSN